MNVGTVEPAYSQTARESILKSRADHIKSELDEAAGDVRATWRTAQRLLHSRHKVVYDDAQCAQLVSTFCQFFVDKVKRIRDNISAALQSSVRRTFAVRQHLGPQLSSFEPVTAEEVRKLLSGMPSKSSPLDVLPCSLLKSCAHVFSPAIARLANLSLHTGKFPARYKRAQVLPLLKKAGLDSTQPADLQPADRVQGPGETRVSTPAAPPAQLCQLQPVPVCIQKGTFYRDCTTRGPGRSLHGGR